MTFLRQVECGLPSRIRNCNEFNFYLARRYGIHVEDHVDSCIGKANHIPELVAIPWQQSW
jgi:hypothetical protein